MVVVNVARINIEVQFHLQSYIVCSCLYFEGRWFWCRFLRSAYQAGVPVFLSGSRLTKSGGKKPTVFVDEQFFQLGSRGIKSELPYFPRNFNLILKYDLSIYFRLQEILNYNDFETRIAMILKNSYM
jgi:hypothetical protein